MRAVFLSCLFLFSGLAIAGQPPAPPAKPPVGIEGILLMRDDGDGNADEETSIFGQEDVPIHCRILLDSFRPATVKMNLIAMDVEGFKAGSQIITVSYKTNGEQNIVNFKGSPDDVWLAGKYRIDIFVDENFAGNKEFEILQTATVQPAAQTDPAAAKPKTKPAARRLRKN